MLADIPVGFFSDIISRRNVLILGLLFRIIFCLFCLTGANIYIFGLSMIFVGLGNSCIWTHVWNYFYDYKKELNDIQSFPSFMGKFYAISNLAIAIAGFIGVYVFQHTNYQGIFIGSIISMIIAILILLKLPNYKPKKTIRTAKALKVSSPMHFISLLNELLKKPKITRLLLFTILADTMFIVFLDVNTTLMNLSDFSPDKISKIVGTVAFIRIFTNYLSGKTESFMKFRRMHSILFLLMIFSICVSVRNSIYVIMTVSLYLCIYPFFDTSIKTKLEHKLDCNTRATVMALASLFVSIFAILFNTIIGIVAAQNNYFAAPFCIFLIVIIILFFIRNITQCYRLDLYIRHFIKKYSIK